MEEVPENIPILFDTRVIIVTEFFKIFKFIVNVYLIFLFVFHKAIVLRHSLPNHFLLLSKIKLITCYFLCFKH